MDYLATLHRQAVRRRDYLKAWAVERARDDARLEEWGYAPDVAERLRADAPRQLAAAEEEVRRTARLGNFAWRDSTGTLQLVSQNRAARRETMKRVRRAQAIQRKR